MMKLSFLTWIRFTVWIAIGKTLIEQSENVWTKLLITKQTPHIVDRYGPWVSSCYYWLTANMVSDLLTEYGPGLAMMARFLRWHGVPVVTGPVVVCWPMHRTYLGKPYLGHHPLHHPLSGLSVRVMEPCLSQNWPRKKLLCGTFPCRLFISKHIKSWK